jgi:tetratricopeptide (TPR) repeat protein
VDYTLIERQVRILGVSTVAMRSSLQVLACLCLHAWSSANAECLCSVDASSSLEQEVRNGFWTSDYVGLIEIQSTKTKTFSHEENVADWNPKTLQSEETTRVMTEHRLVAKFTPIRVYKGERSATYVETATEASSCGVAFEPGSRYLVYATGSDEEGHILTGTCTRTAPAEKAAQDMEALNAITRSRSVLFQSSTAELRFNEALALIRLNTDEGDELSQAMTTAEELSRSDPLSGYSQTLQAELLSTWHLADDGRSTELRQDILALADEALRLNPKLAQAHVARARTYMSAFKLKEAGEEIQTALRIDPQLEGALFVQADIYFRLNNSVTAESWMQHFIAVTKQPIQKANGYQWIGNMRRDYAYHPEAIHRPTDLLLAKLAYRKSIDLDPNNARRLAEFAAFLNEFSADFAGAETYATKSLAVQESPHARYHLAAARYQALQAKGAAIDAQSLRESIADIGTSTGISLDVAVDYPGFRDVINVRLTRLQRRMQSADR